MERERLGDTEVGPTRQRAGPAEGHCGLYTIDPVSPEVPALWTGYSERTLESMLQRELWPWLAGSPRTWEAGSWRREPVRGLAGFRAGGDRPGLGLRAGLGRGGPWVHLGRVMDPTCPLLTTVPRLCSWDV